MFLEAPKKHQKKTSILGCIFGPFWLPKCLHFCFILHLFFGIFFAEKMIPIFLCFSPPSGCPDTRICWQGQYFHGVGASRTCFNFFPNFTPKSSPNGIQMAFEMYQKKRKIFSLIFYHQTTYTNALAIILLMNYHIRIFDISNTFPNYPPVPTHLNCVILFVNDPEVY